jgi:uncharacterized membrane protein
MHKGRLEAFSDGVIAIIITIMVLEFKVPATSDFSALYAMAPTFLSYALSFIFVGIYWNNHHHLLQVVQHVHGSTLWANLHLLFWLSLVPFATAWMGQTSYSATPVALYGVILFCASIAYFILTRVLLRHHARDSVLAKAIGNDFKGRISSVIYILGIALSFVRPYLGYSLYIVVALMWLVPDRRIERVVET